MKKVYIRADGSNIMGLGHVYRSFALADFLCKTFDCHLIIKHPSDKLRNEAAKYFSSVIDLVEGTSQVGEFETISSLVTREDIVVLDGYAFDTAYQLQIKQIGCSLVCIDDIHAYRFIADVVINHAVGIQPADYILDAATRLYLGPLYALLRRPFLEAARRGKQRGDNRALFICLGGADPINRTLDVVKHVTQTVKESHIDNFHVNVVIGSAYKHESSLLEYSQEHALPLLTIHRNLSAADMIGLMQRCGMAVCSPSTITFEYAAVSLGTLFLCKTADNQADFYEHMVNTGAAKVFFEDFKQEVITDVPQTGETSFSLMLDGNQNMRILDIFCDLTR